MTTENPEKQTYMCTSEKDGTVVDVTMMSTLASAHVYCALGRHKGYVCKVHDMSHVNRRIILTDEPDAKKYRPLQKKWAKRVRCRETGETWATTSDFQKYIGLKRWAMETKIREHIPINGKTYEFVNFCS